MTREPIAIVGIGCRFPGGADRPEAFWRLLAEGLDATGEVPADRWNQERFYHPDPQVPGRMNVRRGGFLKESFDSFDAAFFGISPREAARLDPQQRLLLEVTWEALEDAGIPPDRIGGSTTGVFVGGFLLDAAQAQLAEANRSLVDTHTSTGTTLTMLAARLAWMFDLRGPAVSMDTACSSSLVAAHYACTSLWAGDCTQAIVGGVNLMFSPNVFLSVAKAGLLSADGRCKAFDARADGYVRAEGAGVVILKPLSAALRDRDPLYAVIRGTACNQDGRTAAGITVPSQAAQEAVMTLAYERAGIEPAEVQLVEAHGTGTAVGDPTEANAIGSVLGKGRPHGQACLLGSVKGNVGHLEGAAGVAGLIKASLAIKKRLVPPHVYVDNPNPNIAFSELGLRLPRELEPWPQTGGLRRAGVNSFGYGGTNAHVVLEEPPPTTVSAAEPMARPLLLPLSARSEGALRALATSYMDFLAPDAAGARAAPLDLGYSTGCRRSHHAHRLALVGESAEELRESLRSFVAGEDRASAALGHARAVPRLTWVFTGMGPQWFAMGRALFEREPVYRHALEECDALYQALGAGSIIAELMKDEASSRMGETAVAQTANFAVQAGLTALWRSFGIEPHAIVGHSVGEVGAAYASGALSLEDAVAVSYHRGRLQQTLRGQGGMLAVALGGEEAAKLVERYKGRVAVAAMNGPATSTLAGDLVALDEIATLLTTQDVFARKLRVEVPYHSAFMDPIKDELLSSLQALRPRPAKVPLYSTVTGDRIEGEALGAKYWWRNVRESVRFAGALDVILQAGTEAFVEIGPHPVLSSAIGECLRAQKAAALVVPSLHREKPEQLTLLGSLGRLYVEGAPIDWGTLYGAGSFIALPSYVWQRQRHLVESHQARQHRLGVDEHPLLGHRLETPAPTWETELDRSALPYLEDHKLQGEVVYPAAGFLEVALAGVRSSQPEGPWVLTDVDLHQALMLGERPVTTMRLSMSGDDGAFTIHSVDADRADDDDLGVTAAGTAPSRWSRHVTGVSSRAPALAVPDRVDLQELQRRLEREVAGEHVYERLSQRGFEYGPRFQGIVRLWHRGGETLSEILMPDPAPGERSGDYSLHPTALDACLQGVLFAQGASNEASLGLHLPVRFSRLTVYGKLGRRLFAHARITRASAGRTEADLQIVDAHGGVLADARGLVLRALPSAGASLSHQAAGYRNTWLPADLPVPGAGERGSWLLLSGGDALGAALATQLKLAGLHVIAATAGEERRALSPTEAVVRADDSEDLDWLVDQAAGQGRRLAGVVCLWGLREEKAAAVDVPPRLMTDASRVVKLVQAVLRRSLPEPPRLWFVARGGQPVADKGVQAPEAGVQIGLVRVLRTEQRQLRASTVDLDPDEREDDAELLAGELLAQSPEQEVAYRDGARYVSRYQPVGLADLPARMELTDASATPVRLERERAGEGTYLARRFELREPGPDEVTLRVMGAGIPGEGGLCCAGEVVALGAGAQGLAVGDRVVALASEELASFATLATSRLVKLTASFSFEQGAALSPLVIAHHALHNVARVRRGDRLMVGDVPRGLAAAAREIALAAGARVLRPEEDDADVVLGRLSPDSISSALLTLRRGGRFVGLSSAVSADEIFRLDLGQLGRRNIGIATLNPRSAAADDASALVEALRSVVALVDENGLDAPAPEVLPLAALLEERGAALHDDDEAIVSFGAESISAVAGLTFREDASYLLTGGLAGLGFEAARWMVANGARHLMIVSRRGPDGPGARDAVEELQRCGANVVVGQVDVTDGAQLSLVLDELARTMPPLRGVVHTAGVYGDWSTLDRLSDEELRAVIGPKAAGAWNLHEYTRKAPLDLFVLFSSITSQIGGLGFGAYAAANAFLDALAHYRKAEGLPALVVNWGGVSDTGIIQQSEAMQSRTAKMGVRALPAATLLAHLGPLLGSDETQMSVALHDFDAWSRMHAGFASVPSWAPLFESDEPGGRGSASSSAGDRLRAAMRDARPEDRETLLALHLRRAAARILRGAEENIDLDVSLIDLGFDSLMSGELRAAIGAELDLDVPIIALIRGPSLHELASALQAQVMPDTSARPEGDDLMSQLSSHALEEELALIEGLSDEQAQQQLGSVVASHREDGHGD